METKEKILTEKRLSTMEQKIDNLIESVERVNNAVEKVDTKLEKHVQWESEKYEKLDSKYSAKWVETLTLTIAGGLIVAIGIAIFNFMTK